MPEYPNVPPSSGGEDLPIKKIDLSKSIDFEVIAEGVSGAISRGAVRGWQVQNRLAKASVKELERLEDASNEAVYSKQKARIISLQRDKAVVAEHLRLAELGGDKEQINRIKTISANYDKMISQAEKGEKGFLGRTGVQFDQIVGKTKDQYKELFSMLGIWGLLAAAVMRYFANLSEVAKLTTQLRSAGAVGAGLGLAGAHVRAEEIQQRFFGTAMSQPLLSAAIGPTQQRQMLGVMAEAPRTLDNTGKAFRTMLGVFATELPDAESITQLYTSAMKQANISADDLTNTFVHLGKTEIGGKDIAERLKVSHIELIGTWVKAANTLRGVTTNTQLATKLLDDLSSTLGTAFSAEEAKRWADAISSTVGHISFQRLLGLEAYGLGRMPTDKEVEGMIENPMKTMGSSLTKMFDNLRLDQGPNAAARRLAAIEQVRNQFAPELGEFGIRGLKYIPEIMKKMGEEGKDFDITAAMEKATGFKTTHTLMTQGLKELVTIGGPIKALENWGNNLFVTFLNRFDKIISLILDYTGKANLATSNIMPPGDWSETQRENIKMTQYNIVARMRRLNDQKSETPPAFRSQVTSSMQNVASGTITP